MDMRIDAVEARILGALIEKEMATPDYYPLTLNALVNACNQKTNRAPVMELDEDTVLDSLEKLRSKRLVMQVKTHGSRAVKYEQHLREIAEFSKSEAAILCMLLLRGPQTAGELRTRSNRLVPFHGLAAVEHTLQTLADHENGPFAIRLPRKPGQKENRYAHLFGETDAAEAAFDAPENEGEDEDARPDSDRLEMLENRIDELVAEVEALKESLEEFKSRFE